MYKSSLRHVHDPVLLPFKVEVYKSVRRSTLPPWPFYEYPQVLHNPLSHALKFGVWCAVSARKVRGSCFFFHKERIPAPTFR